MAEAELEFSDFVTDKDGDYSKAQFQALARQLIEQGRDPRRVFLAMYRAASFASLEHSVGEHYYFTKFVAVSATEYLPDLDAAFDRLETKQKLQ